MSHSIIVEDYDNQEAIHLGQEYAQKLEALANAALPLALDNPSHGGGVLPSLDFVEISIVDDETIAQVHVDFMDVPGATDVITFAHGEIVISTETAEVYAKDYGHSTERELFLYVIHGLLHLSGHEDADPVERQQMEKIQFSILEQLWPS